MGIGRLIGRRRDAGIPFALPRVMLRSLTVLACLAVTGCAAITQTDGGLRAENDRAEYRESSAIAASALVFAPRLGQGDVSAELARDDRQPAAFVGFDGPITEYYHIETYDRQISGGGYGPFGNYGYGYGGGGDRYERRAYIDKIGVLYR